MSSALNGSRGSCVKSSKLPQLMPPESALVGFEDYKSETSQIWCVGLKGSQISVEISPSVLEATFAATNQILVKLHCG